MKYSLRIIFTVLLISMKGFAQQKASLLEDLMRKNPQHFNHILEHRNDYEVQIIYTQIDRDNNNKPTFKSFYFNVDSTRYFYPASTIKLPLVLLSLEKLNALQIPGLNKYTRIVHDSVYSGQLAAKFDSTSATGFCSLEHYMKKILLVSDNDGYNRLYEFMGQEAVNRRLHELGYTTTRIVHRLERPLSRDENQHTEAVTFLDGDKVVYKQPMLFNRNPIEVKRKILKGTGFVRNDSLINKPFDFTYKNFYPLNEQQKLLRVLLFPDCFPAKTRFKITEEDRSFVLKYMSQLPRETKYPNYGQDTTYYDAYCKFLMFGNSKETIPSNIRIFNKIGDAYGFLIDNAYVVDFENKTEFMLSAVINTNTDGIYNDEKYDYEILGFPFMRDLGQLIYQYELKRKRKYKPDLAAFKMQYDLH